VLGQTVKLDGTGSTGEIDSYAWTQTAGPAVTLTGDTSSVATFVPSEVGSYEFKLTVAGPGGVGAPTTVAVDVINVVAPVADAGPDQTVVRGRTVTLNGSASQAAESYSWRQVSGPAVTLIGATSARPTFTYQVQAMPAVPGPNAGYVYNNDPVVLELTVRNAAGTNVDLVVIRPQAESLTGFTARYRTGGNEWRITGNTNLLAGQRFAMVLGSTLTGRVIGAVGTVDAAGVLTVRATGPVPGTVRTISIVTATGGRQLAVPVTVTN
jgi:hypothetical protein